MNSGKFVVAIFQKMLDYDIGNCKGYSGQYLWFVDDRYRGMEVAFCASCMPRFPV